MLKSLIVPLLVSSITCAIGSLDLKMSGKIAKRYDGNAIIGMTSSSSHKKKYNFPCIRSFRAITYYLTTTFSAVVLGIILVTTIRPGVIGGDDSISTNTVSKSEAKRVYTVDTLLDLIR